MIKCLFVTGRHVQLSFSEEDVLAIRDNATAIVTDAEGVLAVAERRGYQDIDPEHCWEEWLDFNRQD